MKYYERIVSTTKNFYLKKNRKLFCLNFKFLLNVPQILDKAYKFRSDLNFKFIYIPKKNQNKEP